MVKISDPRGDIAAVAMRSLRADNSFKIIKKIVKKNNKVKSFDENKLNLDKIDSNFHSDFLSSPDSVKQELIFLWEEVGDLYEELDNLKDELQNIVNESNESPTIFKKRMNIMGP